MCGFIVEVMNSSWVNLLCFIISVFAGCHYQPFPKSVAVFDDNILMRV
jgi:hypothetical protein